MEASLVFSRLRANGLVFESLLRDTPPAQRTWKPQPESWSLLEVVCHLYDEEREDFRSRLRSVLEDPSKPLPPIDPQTWVTERGYLSQDFAVKLDAFLHERVASVRWLESLVAPEWESAYPHPKFGPLTARMFLVNWLAHDYLHIRQVVRLQHQHLQATSRVSLDYAGSW